MQSKMQPFRSLVIILLKEAVCAVMWLTSQVQNRSPLFVEQALNKQDSRQLKKNEKKKTESVVCS